MTNPNVLLGCAIGDALGVFAESKPPSYQPLLDWDEKSFLGSEHHGLKPTCYSDDTMFSMALTQSLIDCKGFDPNDVSAKYVEMFVNKTIRGYGNSTLLAINKLIEGVHFSESGTVGSTGNGSAMRVSPLGVYYRDDLQTLIKTVTVDAKITHNSKDAIAGSLAIALAAYYAVNDNTEDLIPKITTHLPGCKIKEKLLGLHDLVNNPLVSPAMALHYLGTKCNVNETVPSCLYLFLKFNNYEKAVVAAIKSGFDTDATAAIVGSLFGAKLGINGIPIDWVNQVEGSKTLIDLDKKLYNNI